MQDWLKRELDVDWLIDSGLLFEVNRQYFHPFGIALTVRIGDDGKKTFGFKDCRANPGNLVFDKNVAEMGVKKFSRFMENFGREQMQRRCNKLGQTVQHVDKV